MTKRIILPVSIIICTLSFTHCKKCPDAKNLGTIKFDQAELKINPYIGTEKPVFKDSTGDSICYTDYSSRNQTNIIWHEYSYGSKDCTPDYYYIDRDLTSFSGHETNTSMDIEMRISPFESPIKKIISIHVTYQDSVKWMFSCFFEFAPNQIIAPSPNYYGSSVAFSDSLWVGPTKFSSVYTLTQNQEPENGKNLKTVYYSTFYGIVGFKTDTGHLWCLKSLN